MSHALQLAGQAPPSTAALAPGDIVQITAEAHAWFGVLLVLDEVKPARLRGFCQVPPSELAYLFILPGEVEKVGRAALQLK